MNLREVNRVKYQREIIKPEIGKFYLCKVRDDIHMLTRTDGPGIVSPMTEYNGREFVAVFRGEYGAGHFHAYYSWLPKWVTVIEEVTVDIYNKFMSDTREPHP